MPILMEGCKRVIPMGRSIYTQLKSVYLAAFAEIHQSLITQR